ncbi:hypothetical protein, partial [Chromobacterium violaceum]|uniref:hypothetical protein n=1 Tax=Chromobacterium violaceum TaxID=536 RepID=UPI001B333C57
QFGNGHSRVRFAQEADDLFFGESFLHIQSPCVVDWTLKSCATQYRGDVVSTVLCVLGEGEMKVEKDIISNVFF